MWIILFSEENTACITKAMYSKSWQIIITIEVLKLVERCKIYQHIMVIKEARWPGSDDKHLPAWVAGIQQILNFPPGFSREQGNGNTWIWLRYKLAIYYFFISRKCSKISINIYSHSLCLILSCFLTGWLSDRDYLFMYYLGLYHVTEDLVFSVQNVKHTGPGTMLTFFKSIPICILALVSIYYYLLTRLLRPFIHENTKSNLFVQSELAGTIHKDHT